MWEPEEARSGAVEHRFGDLEPGGTQREAGADGLEQCLLHGPQPIEEEETCRAGDAGEPLAFQRSVDPAGEFREVTVRGALFHVDAEIVMSTDGDQAVITAVRHIEADRGTPSAYDGEWLAVIQVTE